MSACNPFAHSSRFIFFVTVVLASLLVNACSSGTDSAAVSGKSSEINLSIQAPTQFEEPFCVRIEVSGGNFSTISDEMMYPAGTVVIETVVPNIPEGTDRAVELGIFASGTCGPVATGDWYGKATDVSVVAGQVTLVPMTLVQQNPAPGTGSIIIRSGEPVLRTLLHGEVVNEAADPVADAHCEIYEDTTNIGSVDSGNTAMDLGVLNTPVEVNVGTTQLLLRCGHPGYAPALEQADLVLDPNDPNYGTFTATVIMKRGVSLEILKSGNEGLTARVHIPTVKLRKISTPAGEFEMVENDDDAFALREGGEDNLSQPKVPVLTFYFAVPLNEEPGAISVQPESGGNTMPAKLYPVQPPHYDRAGLNEGDPNRDDDVPFVYDPKLYLAGASSVGEFELMDRVTGDESVNIYALKINLTDYQPRTEMLTTYTSLLVDIPFSGDPNACFKATRVASGLQRDDIDQLIEEQPVGIVNSVVDPTLFERYGCTFEINPNIFGARLIIISDPAFLAASHDLEVHKDAHGISTIVVSTDNIGTGSPTASQIKDYVANAYNNWFIQPRWLLLMGDSEFIPTYYDSLTSDATAYNAGDMYYGQINGDIYSDPVLGIGRIPVDTAVQAQSVVDKIKEYENNPPGSLIFDNPYYSSVVFAAEFQDNGADACCAALDGRADRWFAEVSEKIRNHIIGQGISVDRVYRTEPLNASPQQWRGGASVPWYLKKPTFAWDGDKFDVITAVNDGRSILYHRDHGWWWGWGTPGFGTSDLNSISVTNNEFPVVYSINCASGIFDNETVDLPANKIGAGYGPGVNSVYWAEKFLRKDDGAIAVIGDTRSSSTVSNNHLAEGLFDATWPGHKPFGGMVPIRKVGDILNHAKAYVKTQVDPTAARKENVIFNVLGDPTIELRTRPQKTISIGTLIPKPGIIDFGIVCLSCPFSMEPVSVVMQDLKGNVVGRGLGHYNGRSFEGSIEVGNFVGDLQVTVSGPEVLTEQVLFNNAPQALNIQ